MLLSEGTAMTDDTAAPADAPPARRAAFRRWRRSRPFAGGLLLVVAGVEMFFSGQLDFGELHIQLGIEGLQATIIPILLVLLGVLAVSMPAHHVFYGVIALAVALYSLVGVNLGGFLVGMLLGCVGGVLVVAWMPRTKRVHAGEPPA
ncbi:DUF6114 domain-containing protein [Microbacterium sp. NPDC058342]|uniref:DUF6114 domain-containing protein n=1 Tax=Microbacterium sp. NPDC058342 TaxID=3346454 RepID=UPI00364DE99D